MNPLPVEQFRATLNDPKLQLTIYDATGRLMEKRKAAIQPGSIENFEGYRDQANRIKKHTIENLDYYLEEFERNAAARGAHVLWARDGEDAKRQILDLARRKGVRKIVKSKSMTTEEIDLNEALEHDHLDVVETDLGEYILQLSHERPYHIVAPALHKTRYQVADLFTEKLGVEHEEVIEKQTMIARRVLREKFLEGELGMTGANFLIADSGAIVVVENEGNARLSSSAPRIQVAVAGIEKLIPRAQDLATFLKVLGRSATGQALTVYTSFLAGPRRTDEIDGPEEFYLVLIDGGRTRLLADAEKRESLYCIRCGACLNHCPVYRKIGGHNYPWVYSGPIGSILAPQFHGVTKDPWLPYASSLCGACYEVCPVKINIPQILLELRRDVTNAKANLGKGRLEKLAFRLWAWVMCRPRLYELGASAGRALFGGDGAWLSRSPLPVRVPPLDNWLSQRDLPPPPARSFHDLWRDRQALRGRTKAPAGKDQPS